LETFVLLNIFYFFFGTLLTNIKQNLIYTWIYLFLG